MKPIAVPADAHCAAILPGCDFADAYRMNIRSDLDAISISKLMLGRTPRWIGLLLALRDGIIGKLGLKTMADIAGSDPCIGHFPVLSESPQQVTLGGDDSHLDFRICVDVVALENGMQQITTTTLVRTNNWLGRQYLSLVLPFHRLIVPAMMAQAG